MNEQEFRIWLQQQGYGVGTINSRISNCLRVCEHEGDIDSHYKTDYCKNLFSRLAYSTYDEKCKNTPKHKIPIYGNIRNGTATLKRAVKLYVQFLEDSYSHKSSINTSTPDKASAPQAAMSSEFILDSYAQFLEYFSIDCDSFYSFGLENTIFASPDYAFAQWIELKEKLITNKSLTIRGYGRQGRHTDLYCRLYSFLFSNDNINEDATNNAVPRSNIQAATGYRINQSILNYQCSHIFGHTKNPLLFEAVWNICFTPKIFDPLTGHEAKGPWPNEYQKLFQSIVTQRFNKCIVDYNKFVAEHNVLSKIPAFVSSLAGQYDSALLQKFQEDALSEWLPICAE